MHTTFWSQNHHHGDRPETESTSETSVNFYQTTRCNNNPQDSYLHTRRRENFKSDHGDLMTFLAKQCLI
jgi:hypothetical protein